MDRDEEPGGDLAALLFRIAPDGPKPVVRLGSLGICFPVTGRAEKSVLRPMVNSLAVVFREAGRELGRATRRRRGS